MKVVVWFALHGNGKRSIFDRYLPASVLQITPLATLGGGIASL
jgi:hypothetical protein